LVRFCSSPVAPRLRDEFRFFPMIAMSCDLGDFQYPPPFFQLYCKQRYFPNLTLAWPLGDAWATLAWPLGGPRATQTQSQSGRGSQPIKHKMQRTSVALPSKINPKNEIAIPRGPFIWLRYLQQPNRTRGICSAVASGSNHSHLRPPTDL